MANVLYCQDEHCGHAVGPIDQGEALFFAKFDRCDAGCRERIGGIERVARAVSDAAFAHEDERTVGEGSKVTRTSERSVFVDDRSESSVEYGGVGFDHDGANSRSAGHES